MKSIFKDLLSEEDKIRQQKIKDLLNQLPKFDKPTISSQLHLIKKRNFYLDEKRIVSSGDILSRPLERFEIGKHFEMLHYGIVFGVDKDKQNLILEMNSESNVSIVTLKTFLTKKYFVTDIEIEKRKPQNVKFIDIIQRADIVVNEKYSATELNCEQFVNFCVFGIKESKGLQNTAKFVSSILDILATFVDYKIAYTADEQIKKSFRELNNKTKKLSENIKGLK